MLRFRILRMSSDKIKHQHENNPVVLHLYKSNRRIKASARLIWTQ
jgi:hypothetical protein